MRADSDHTTVVTPRLRAGVALAEGTSLDVSYAVDVWSSASIDIRTSASRPITEQRDELNINLSHELADISVRGGYRFSTEPDYDSHGGSVGLSTDLADNNATVALDASAFFDTVGRVGDPNFARDVHSYTARLSFTQVLGPTTIAQGIYELGRAEGYLSSPYRYVGIGSVDASCVGALPVQACIAEANPEERMRHAFAVRGRQALSDVLSLGASYRFYTDDWKLVSHTVEGDVGYAPGSNTLLTLRYRFYVQTSAFHYRSRYPTFRSGRQFYTRDKELSPFTAHRIGFDAEQAFVLDDVGTRLRAIASLGWTGYAYTDVPRLSGINALEATLSLGFEL